MKLTYKTLLVCIFLCLIQPIQAGECGKSNSISNNFETSIVVGDTTFRSLTPQFFGFNLELIEFQNSLWDSSRNRVDPNVIQHLQRFPGAVYRYPGGTVANHFNWRASTGPVANRIPQQVAEYQGAKVVLFGPSEYLDFVAQVNGTAWYVLNLYGTLQMSLSPQSMATSAADLAKFMHTAQKNGFPSIYRWELGNELDRGRYRLSASQYANIAKLVAASLKSDIHDSKMVIMAQDWAHTGANTPGVNYNTFTARELLQFSSEFASHLYYDGAPWGPPVPRLVKQLCKNLAEIKSAGPSASVWVTEHGRTPLGTPADVKWKNNWPQTADMSAAISATDMMISLANTKNVSGAFIHSLHGSTGPWPLFHKMSSGTIYPSAVYWALALLRESMLEDVLTSTISVTNSGGSATGYDTNVVVLANKSRSKFALWSANRSDAAAKFHLISPDLSGRRVLLKIATLSSQAPTDNNYAEQYKIFPMRQETAVDVDSAGGFSILAPAYSVMTVTFGAK